MRIRMAARPALHVALRVALLLGAFGCAPGASEDRDGRDGPAEEAGRPNILFIFSDDHAAHAIGAYGGHLAGVAPTPTLDRLAREGILFRDAFVANSICVPSRATILTGTHSHVNGAITNAVPFDGSQVTFPKLLREAGYQTALIGKWHLQTEPTGFDHWDILTGFGGQGSYYNPTFATATDSSRVTGYTTDIVTDKALDWLRTDRDPERPFLLMVQHKAPHVPWEPGPQELTLLDGVDVPEPATLFDDHAGRVEAAGRTYMTLERHMGPAILKLEPPATLNEEQRAVWDAAYGPKNDAFREEQPEGRELVRWRYQRYIKDYLRTVAGVDRNVGRLLDYLDASGLADHTLVVYASDQGFFLGDHGWYDKRWMYDESLRFPLIARWPGVISAGAEDSHLVQNLDIAQTFLDVAGVPAPERMQGRSLLPLLRGEDPAEWREALFYQYYEHGAHGVPRQHGVRTERHKLVHYPTTDEWELFDLEADPYELRSVYGDPRYADVEARMEALLSGLRERYDVPEGQPGPEPAPPAGGGS